MNDMLTSGPDLKYARMRRQVTQAELAEAMGVSTATVTRLEQRFAVKPDVARRYQEALATFPSLTGPAESPRVA